MSKIPDWKVKDPGHAARGRQANGMAETEKRGLMALRTR